MPVAESPGFNLWALSESLGQRKILGLGVLLAWLVLFHLLVNVWLLCVFTSLLVVLGGWLGSRAALDGNSLLHLEHFLPLGQTLAATRSSDEDDSERRLDGEIRSAVAKAVRDFVSSWYRELVSEEEGEFEQEVCNATLAAAAELKRRARRVDRRALAQRVLELCGCHLQSYGRAKERQAQEQGEGSRLSLWELYSEADEPHPAMGSAAAELSYSRAVVDLVMQVLVPQPHLESRTGRYMVGELITCNVLLPLVARVTNPDWLNLTVVDVFTNSGSGQGEAAEAEPLQQTPHLEHQQLPCDPSWASDLCRYPPWGQVDAQSMQRDASSSTTAFSDSTESRLQTRSPSAESAQGNGMAPGDLLRPPYRAGHLYLQTDSDLGSPPSDGKTPSAESLKQADSGESVADRFCDCVSPTDFCGLVCLEEESLGLLEKRARPKVLVSEPHAGATGPVEDPPSAPRSLCLSPFCFESLGSPDGPVRVQNLRITGTVAAKEHRGTGLHPYTLYTVKYETTADTEGPDQPVVNHKVNRRYSEFLNLQTRLEERPELKKVVRNMKGPKKLFPDLPFGNLDVDRVEARKSQLETFLKQLCTIPETANSEEMQEFLALNTDASTTFEKKPCASRIDKLVVNAIVDTLKTAFPRTDAQSPTDDGEQDPKPKSRLRFSSKIAPTLNVPDLQPKVMYCFSEGSTVFRGLSITGLERYVGEQERLLCSPLRTDSVEGKWVGVEWGEDRESSRAPQRRPRATDTALADVCLNILCLLMKDHWSWLCTENIQKTIRLLFGTFIERWLEVGITHLTSAPCWVIYLRVLQEAVWPGGELPVEPRPERSPSQREETRQQCLHCLMQLLPDLIPDMLGSEKYKLCWEHVLESLQDPNIIRHLVYCTFDLLLEFLIPESSDEGFQRFLLHSLSGDVDRASPYA